MIFGLGGSTETETEVDVYHVSFVNDIEVTLEAEGEINAELDVDSEIETTLEAD